MSFFGRSAAAHPNKAPGFGALPDPFAGIAPSHGAAAAGIDDDDDGIDFEDTYDGLGDALDDADDAFNDDTFGAGGASRDFDFAGTTSKFTGLPVAGLNQQQTQTQSQRQTQSYAQPQPQSYAQQPKQSTAFGSAAKASRSGYEKYMVPGAIPDLQVDPSLWGLDAAPEPPSSSLQPARMFEADPPLQPAAQKKMMSLEEVEAAMAAQSKTCTPAAAMPQYPPPYQQQHHHHQQQQGYPPQYDTPPPQSMQILQNRQHQSRPSAGNAPMPYMYEQGPPPGQPTQHWAQHHQGPPPQAQAELPGQATRAMRSGQAPQILQRPHVSQQQHQHQQQEAQQPQQEKEVTAAPPTAPRQILKNTQRQAQASQPQPPAQQTIIAADGKKISLPVITHQSQLAELTEEQRQAFMAEEAKRAKRNHKIFMLSKGNGLMTPQDKNFITRIQLQQLMAATAGTVNEQDPEAVTAEDFYYQVHRQIVSRPNPQQQPNSSNNNQNNNNNQPLRDFAQTYLFQTGGRPGGMHNRRSARGGGDNHMHRMQQQVQRAVEAAKAKPKNKQLVIEGSLGKISFSNAKTPKPLVNIKRNNNNNNNDKTPPKTLSATDRKAILKNIEAAYASLMKIEDHEQQVPPAPLNEADPTTAEPFVEWRQKFKQLNAQLWSDLKIMDPITPNSTTMHPFIAFLSYPKGKRAMPRIFHSLDPEQRLTVLTSIMVQLDSLDVVRSSSSSSSTAPPAQPPSVAQEQQDLFIQAVMPVLFHFVTEAPLHVLIGLVGLFLDRVNAASVLRSRVGVEILTMLLSQAEIIRKSIDPATDEAWREWVGVYQRLFDLVEPLLPDIFPGGSAGGAVAPGKDDVYVWQFLATLGSGANPEQQQRLVIAVKERVMEVVSASKTLPANEAAQRRGNVNLFMQAIGLDVDLLDS